MVKIRMIRVLVANEGKAIVSPNVDFRRILFDEKI